MLKKPGGMHNPITAIYLLVALALLVGMFFVPTGPFHPALTVERPDTATLDVIKSVTQLATTLTTALLAAAGTVAIKGRDWTSQWGKKESFLVILVFVCGAISYFGVYFCQITLLTMLDKSTIDISATGFSWSLRLQYGGIISGVFFLGLVFSLILEKWSPKS